MSKTLLQFGRITPFIILAGLLTGPAFAEPRGHWQFTEDGTGVELRSCSTSAAALCGVITRLPKSAKALSPAERGATPEPQKIPSPGSEVGVVSENGK
jgi:hypothetical protein